MAEMKFLINYVDSTHIYASYPANYIEVDLTNDYLIWTKGDDTVKDLMTHAPTPGELNAAAQEISEEEDIMVALCLLMDYSHNVGGSYYTHKVLGMGENKQYPFCFSFNGATATEPQLEAWDDITHTTFVKNVLGLGVTLDSMIKAKCTTNTLPGVDWPGTPIAGGSNVVLLNDGAGALSGAKDLYSNIKIVLPEDYTIPAVESFILTVRYTFS